MKRLHKQYFHPTNASGILKGQQWIKLKELSSTFAADVKFAVSIKGIENAFDKIPRFDRIPRNSEYGTLNKNFYIHVFWTSCTLKGLIKSNMSTPCCTLLNHSQPNPVKPPSLPQGRTDLWVYSGITQKSFQTTSQILCVHTHRCSLQWDECNSFPPTMHFMSQGGGRILRIAWQNPSASWEFPKKVPTTLRALNQQPGSLQCQWHLAFGTQETGFSAFQWQLLMAQLPSVWGSSSNQFPR